jgi:putative flippase GtrA
LLPKIAQLLQLSPQSRQFISKISKFSVVSCVGLVINTITFSFFLREIPIVFPIYPILLDFTLPMRLWEFLSVSIAILVTTIWNFIINKLWTFRLHGEDKTLVVQTTQYMIVGAIGAVENLSIYGFLTTFLYIQPITAEIVAFIVSVLSNFILNNYWTFQERK